jgi:PPM family protein phosphatase
MNLSACGTSDVGLVRSNNEDSCFVSAADGLFIVADGMGGHAAGEVASDLAIRAVRERVRNATGDDPRALLADAVAAANLAVRQASASNPAWRGMGTTLTILLLQAAQAHLAHVGDSRLYRYRDNRLEQLSDDQTLVEEQLRQGMISDHEAATSRLRHVLLQAVGTADELELCQKTLPLAERDRFLLCSDGVTDLLSDARLAELIATSSDLQLLCARLVDAAKAAGGRDNITVVLVEVESL